ncbi:hypothetical protein MKSMC1_52110 [Mycobacterium kansasii]|nr:hypothetical protein MKSMC1_52110 [Mycobacterium kansasii]
MAGGDASTGPEQWTLPTVSRVPAFVDFKHNVLDGRDASLCCRD